MFSLESVKSSDLLIFSILLSAVMYGFLRSQKSRCSQSTVLFQRLLLGVLAAGFFEALAWNFSASGSAAFRPYHYLSNMLFFLVNLLPASLGLHYLDYITSVSREKNQRKLFLFLLPVYLNAGFVIVNLFSDGFLFSIDASNTYHRGIAAYIGNAFTLLFSVSVVICLFRKKQMVTGRITQVILILTLLPIGGAVLQMLFLGLSFAIPAYTLGIFVTFLLMEREELLKDPLTLLNSRVQMENRLLYKIRAQEPFTAIMIDVNDFKNINDLHGHAVGDEVLKDVSRILLSCANFEDFVCRFGGDEFFVILESKKDIGRNYIKRIDQILADYSQNKPFTTALSYGALYVDHLVKYEADEIVRATDELMYKDKETRRREGSGISKEQPPQ